MANQTKKHSAQKPKTASSSDSELMLGIFGACALLIVSLILLRRVGQLYVTSDGFDLIYPGSLRCFRICIPIVLAGIAVPFFWRRPLVRKIGSAVAVIAALAGLSGLLLRYYWTDYLTFLYYLHAMVYCLYIVFMLYRAEFFVVSLVTGLAGGFFFSFYHSASLAGQNVILLIALLAAAAGAAVLAHLADRHNGSVVLGKKTFRVFPAGYNPLAVYIVCAVWVVCLAASLLLGSLFSYYCMFAAIAIELIAAVYYTFQLK